MQIVTGRRGEPHVTSRQMQAVYRSFLGDFALLDIGEKLRAEAYSDDIVRVYDGVVSVQGIYAVIAYNQYDEVYIEPVSVGKKRIDTIVLHYTKDNALDVEDMQLDVVQGEEYTDNPIAPIVPEGGDAWEGTTDIQVPIYDVEVTNFGLTVIPHARMLTVIPTLDSIAERIPETVVTGVKGDSEVLYRDGDVNITKANIGLGNVDNTADTDKPISTATQTALNLKADLTYVDAKISAAYHAGGNLTVADLTSALLIADNMGKVYNMSDSGVTTSDFVEGAGKSIREGDNVGICNVGTEESPVYKFDLLSGFVDLSAYATTSAVNAGLEGKVDKVTGKGLSTEDYTTTDKTKLAGISEGATQTIANPADTATETLSKVEIEGTVYDIPQGASGATELSELTDVNLSDVEDGDILQYDETANKWKNSNALQGAKTLTGNPLTIEDAAPVNAINLSMDLEPVQDLHGYANPWVGGAGKNKLPLVLADIKAANTSGTWSGNVYTLSGVIFTLLTDSDGNLIGIKLGGTSSADNVKLRIATDVVLSAETILNGITGGTASTYRIDVTKTGSTDFLADGSKTLSANTYTFDINIRFASVQLNTTLYPMIRLSTETDSSFAPYTNYASISGRSEIAIQRVHDLTGEFEQGAISADDGNTYANCKVDSDSRIRSKDLIQLDTNKSCTITISNGYEYVIQAFNSSQRMYQISGITNLWKNSTITISGIPYIAIAIRKSDQSNITPQEIDSTGLVVSDDSKTYTIQLGQTVYGGQLDVTRGKMVVDKGYATITTLGRNAERSYWATISNAKPGFNIICNKEKTAINSFAIGVFVNDSGFFRINTEASYSSASECINAYGGSLDICYELATPFTIDITPQQIEMLENTNTIYIEYGGDTITLEYQPNNAIGEAVRAVEESYDPEFAVRPVLKKIAFSGTTDTDGSVTLINASDIPSGHKIIPLHITDMTIDGSAGTYFVEYEPYNSGDSVKGYCYFYMSGSQMFPVGKAITGNFYYYDLEV